MQSHIGVSPLGGGGVLDGGTVLFGRWLESRENRQQGLELTQKERKI